MHSNVRLSNLSKLEMVIPMSANSRIKLELVIRKQYVLDASTNGQFGNYRDKQKQQDITKSLALDNDIEEDTL